ncbi:MAG: SGNH/GDSL hydrolase family protein [Pseudomonadota bacterium]|nr:SGNH/GDSL hydrolase family protein [Pseudomonadota bacterium]
MSKRWSICHRLTTAAAALAALLLPTSAFAESVLFVGNSFTFGASSPVWKYRAESVSDLNKGGVGGVPALFKTFAEQAGLDYSVSLETVGGTDLEFHLTQKAQLIDRRWDHVILQSYSTVDKNRPGDPRGLIRSVDKLAGMFRARNPRAAIWLMATWSRADQTYLTSGHWYGKPIGAMAKDVRSAYDEAAAASSLITGVIPVGEAWNRAFDAGIADPDPYDGLARGQVNLWAHDNYHASAFGYYLEALVVFGQLTGRDPRSLGPQETAGYELGFSPEQMTELQKIAFDEIAAQAAKAMPKRNERR